MKFLLVHPATIKKNQKAERMTHSRFGYTFHHVYTYNCTNTYTPAAHYSKNKYFQMKRIYTNEFKIHIRTLFYTICIMHHASSSTQHDNTNQTQSFSLHKMRKLSKIYWCIQKLRGARIHHHPRLLLIGAAVTGSLYRSHTCTCTCTHITRN